MSSNDQVPVFPVSAWSIAPVPERGVIVLKLQYLTSPVNPLESAQETQIFSIQPERAEAFISELQKQLANLKAIGLRVPPESKH